MSETWLSAHLFYGGSLNALLTKVVQPFVEEISQEGLISGFFFIRYAEHGAHIRLRLLGRTARQEHLRERLLAKSQPFFASHPSPSNPLPDSLDTFAYSTDSLRFIDYQPEVARYGNSLTIRLAEQQFELSSRAVLSLFQHYANWNESRALSAAIALHTYFVAASLSAAEAVTLFEAFTQDWLPDQLLSEEVPTLLRSFESRYQTSRLTLLPYIQQCWEMAHCGPKRKKEYASVFFRGSKRIDRNYRSQFPDPLQRMAIYRSFIHMTNNRLGVPNHDEAFIAYLLSQAFREIHCNEKSLTTP